jgi:hypothetical protein
LLRIVAVVAVVGAAFGIWRASTQATGTATLAVSPASRIQLYANRTPFTETLTLANATNVAAYQFRLNWNPNKLQWVSSDMTTVTWLQSTGRGALCGIVYDATSTPTGVLPTSTPTFTPTATGTVPTSTPTNTPNAPTATITATPTPAGNITFGCATLGNSGLGPGLPLGPGADATGVAIAHVTFKSIATAETADQVQLSQVGLNDSLSTPLAITSSNGSVTLAGCYDIDGDGVISILDLSKVAAHFGSTIAVPKPPGWVWVPGYDVDHDNTISILDLARIAAGFGLHCP